MDVPFVRREWRSSAFGSGGSSARAGPTWRRCVAVHVRRAAGRAPSCASAATLPLSGARLHRKLRRAISVRATHASAPCFAASSMLTNAVKYTFNLIKYKSIERSLGYSSEPRVVDIYNAKINAKLNRKNY